MNGIDWSFGDVTVLAFRLVLSFSTLIYIEVYM